MLALWAALAAALAACGGGSDGGSTATMPLLPEAGGSPFVAMTAPPQPTAADPNAVVATATRTLDLRWGSRASPYVLPTTDNVRPVVEELAERNPKAKDQDPSRFFDDRFVRQRAARS